MTFMAVSFQNMAVYSERKTTSKMMNGHKKTQAWGLDLKEATLLQSLKTPGLQNC